MSENGKEKIGGCGGGSDMWPLRLCKDCDMDKLSCIKFHEEHAIYIFNEDLSSYWPSPPNSEYGGHNILTCEHLIYGELCELSSHVCQFGNDEDMAIKCECLLASGICPIEPTNIDVEHMLRLLLDPSSILIMLDLGYKIVKHEGAIDDDGTDSNTG